MKTVSADGDTIDTALSAAVFIDSHCHFDFSDFDGEREKIWQACQSAGVLATIIPGVAPEQWPRAKKLCQNFNAAYFSVGIHPWWIGQLFSENAEVESVIENLQGKQRKALQSDKCVAVGECGLDKMIKTSPNLQYDVFDFQVALAAEYGKPLIIHSRKAHGEVMHHIKHHQPSGGGVIHAFSGSYEAAAQFIDRGFYIGVGGTITYERAKKTRDAIKAIPLDAIVLETDAPDMPLHGRQGQRNSPEFISDIAQVLADLKGETLERVAQKTTENACRLFSLRCESFGV